MAAGTIGGGGDVGGSSGIADVGQSLTVHGSKAVDQRVMLNGVSIMTLQAGGNIGGQQPDVGSAAEIAVDTTSLSAEMATGGVRINFIPKDGGNTFGNSTFFTFANQSMQGNNYTDALKAAGLATPTQIDSTWDLNESIGGPIRRDKAWFWFSTRFNRVECVRGHLREPERLQPERVDLRARHQQPRGEPRQGPAEQPADHLAGVAEDQDRRRAEGRHVVQLPDLHRAGRRPRQTAPPRSPTRARGRQRSALPAAAPGARRVHFAGHRQAPARIRRHAPVRALGQHGPAGDRQRRLARRGAGRGDPEHDLGGRAVQRAWSTAATPPTPSGGLNNTLVPNYTYRVAASYVTGTHTFKTGWNDTFGYLNAYNYAYQPISYTFLNGTPTAVTEYAAPFNAISNENHDFGAFAQDTCQTESRDRHRRGPIRLVQDQFPRADRRRRAARVVGLGQSQHQLPGAGQPRTGKTSPIEWASSTTCAATASRR